MGTGIGRTFNRKKSPEQIQQDTAAAEAAAEKQRLKIERDRLSTRKEGGPRVGLVSGSGRKKKGLLKRKTETRGGLTHG